MKHTPLYDEHKKENARLVEFAGWEMPVQYSGLTEEHLAVRNAAGIFDVSHMGEFLFTGETALQTLQYLTTNDVAKLSIGKAHYSLLCNESGTIIDDIIVYKFNDQKFMMVVNAGNLEKDLEWCRSHIKSGTELKNLSDDYALIALQGPEAQKILQKIISEDLSKLKKFAFIETSFDDSRKIIIARTGYTGEDGFEIFVSPKDAPILWQSITEAGKPLGLKPCGLGARDTLRLEMKYSLYGNDITDETNPIESGLGWVVKPDKGEFIGRSAILRYKNEGINRNSVGFEMLDKGIARHGYPIYIEDKLVGLVTSGSFSPSLEKAIGIGFVPTSSSKIGSEIEIEIRGKMKRAKIVETPFLKRV